MLINCSDFREGILVNQAQIATEANTGAALVIAKK